MIDKIIYDLQDYQRDCVNALRMEYSPSDSENDLEGKKLEKYVKRQGKIINKVIKLLRKIKG